MKINRKVIFVVIIILLFYGTYHSQVLSRLKPPRIKGTLTASPGNYTGILPVTIKFRGSITTDRPCTVKYQFERNDGKMSNPRSLLFKAAGRKNIFFSQIFTVANTGWMRAKILSPVKGFSNKAIYKIVGKKVFVNRTVGRSGQLESISDQVIINRMINDLRNNVKNINKEIQNLLNEIKQKQIAIVQSLKEISYIINQIKDLKDSHYFLIKQLKMELEKLEDGSNQYYSVKREIEEVTSVFELKLSSLEAKIKYQKNIIKKLEKDIENLMSMIETKKAKLAEIEKKIKELQSK